MRTDLLTFGDLNQQHRHTTSPLVKHIVTLAEEGARWLAREYGRLNNAANQLDASARSLRALTAPAKVPCPVPSDGFLTSVGSGVDLTCRSIVELEAAQFHMQALLRATVNRTRAFLAKMEVISQRLSHEAEVFAGATEDYMQANGRAGGFGEALDMVREFLAVDPAATGMASWEDDPNREKEGEQP